MRHDTARPDALGALLADARQQRGLSQARLATRLCASAGVATVTRHEISRWERGDRVPSGFWLAWLAETLDVPFTRLEHAAAQRRARDRAPGHWRLLHPGVYAWMAANPG